MVHLALIVCQRARERRRVRRARGIVELNPHVTALLEAQRLAFVPLALGLGRKQQLKLKRDFRRAGKLLERRFACTADAARAGPEVKVLLERECLQGNELAIVVVDPYLHNNMGSTRSRSITQQHR